MSESKRNNWTRWFKWFSVLTDSQTWALTDPSRTSPLKGNNHKVVPNSSLATKLQIHDDIRGSHISELESKSCSFPVGFFLKNTIFFLNHWLQMAGNFVAFPFSKKIGMLNSKAVLSFSYYKTLSVCIVRPGFEPSTYMNEQVSPPGTTPPTLCE